MNFNRLQIVLIATFAVTACGPIMQPRNAILETLPPLEKFEVLLERGALVRRLPSTPSQDLSLAGGANENAVYSIETDPSNDHIRRVLFDTTKMKSIKKENYEAEIQNWLREFSRNGQFATAWDQLSDQRSFDLSPEITTIVFNQFIDGKLVKDAHLQVVLHRHGTDHYRIGEIINQLAAGGDQKWDEAQVIDTVQLRSDLQMEQFTVESQQSLWVFNADLTSNQADTELRQATSFVLAKGDEKYTIVVDNKSKLLKEAANHHLHLEEVAAKQAVSSSYQRSYLDESYDFFALPQTVVGSSEGLIATTVDGLLPDDFEAAYVRLESPRVVVKQEGDEKATVIRSELNAEKDNHFFEEDKIAALNAYVSVHRINKYARQFLSESELPFLNKELDITVDMQGSCNAYYTTIVRKISLFTEGRGCANVALINDVVYHEWGHGIDDHTGKNIGVTDGAFSEGIGDIVAAYFTGDPEIGRGFLVDSSFGIRSIRTDKRYPEDTGEVHREGGIIASAFWNLREDLIDRYGEKLGSYKAAQLFFRHLLDTDSYLDSYYSVLRLDDDDANPATPSPNYCLINDVFARAGLTDDANCVDTVDAPYDLSEVDRDLSLALTEPEAGKVRLIASTEFADSVSVCFGKRDDCMDGTMSEVSLTLEPSNGDRKFFVSPAPISVKALDLITIIAKNDNGAVIGSRVLKAVEK